MAKQLDTASFSSVTKNEHKVYNFNNMTLMEFAVTFQPHYAKRQETNEDGIDHDVYDDIPIQKGTNL